MSANYVSPKEDGHLMVRNEVYRERTVKLEERDVAMQAALRDLPAQNKENYGYKKAR